MNLGPYLRSARQLTAEQWVQRARCRGRRTAMGMTPTPYHIALRRAAGRLPLPDTGAPDLLAAAAPVAVLQRAAHGEHYAGALRGRFTLLNEAFDFGTPDNIRWRGDFRDGARSLRRTALARMGYAVPLLARADRECLNAVSAILRSLEAQNGWSVGGVFRDVWSPQTASHRLINLLAGLALYRDRGGKAEPEREALILNHARFCAAFVLRNLERDVHYSRLLKNYAALAVYCASLAKVPPELDFLRMAVPHCIRRNVLRDGGHVERSPMVHTLAIVDLKVLHATGLFTDHWRHLLDGTVARMESALAVMSHPDGDIALFNDAWLGEAPRSADIVDPRGLPETCRLPETGYVRIGRGGDAVLFDCGPCGPDDHAEYAHADYLSFELSAGGERVIVDPGVPTFAPGAARETARSAPAHNGPRVDGVGPLEVWKPFRAGGNGSAGEISDATLAGLAPLWCAGWQSAYGQRDFRIRRFVGLWPGEGALVCDLWIGPRLGREASSFLIAAPWQIVATSPLTLANKSRKFTVTTVAGALGPVSSAAHYRRFGVTEPATRIEIDATGSAAQRGLAVWFSWSSRPPPPAEAVRKTIEHLGA